MGMFSGRLLKELQDPAKRRRHMETAINQARDYYGQGLVEQAREGVLVLMDQFDEAGVDRMELLYLAESTLSSDPFWLRAIGDNIVRKTKLSNEEIAYLSRYLSRHPRKLDLWLRLHEERKRQGDDFLEFQAYKQCASCLLPFFPRPRVSEWEDPVTQEKAFRLFETCLQRSLDRLLDMSQVDETGNRLLRAGLTYYPERDDIHLAVAQQICRENRRDSASLKIALETVVRHPDEVVIHAWAGSVLASLPGHEEEGLGLLRQLHRDHPDEPQVREQLVALLKECETLSDFDLIVMEEWFQDYPEDLRALEMLADAYAERKRNDLDALKIYRQAAAESPNRNQYLRLMGEIHASRGNWSEVIEIFNEVLAEGVVTEDIILPLATAFAEFDRTDNEAINVYRQSIDMGSRNREVHFTYCRWLYLHKRNEAESVSQFKETLEIHSDCNWARMGLISHYLATQDYGRALDSALDILSSEEGDLEAARLAGEALSKDFSRRQLARLTKVSPDAARRIFERAHSLHPDAGPLAEGLVRHRLAAGEGSEETARLLGDVCRRNPEALDLRLARADMLWDLGQRENACALYRELFERVRAIPRSSGSRILSPKVRQRIINRMLEEIAKPPGPAPEDIDILLEAASDPECPSETLLITARTVVKQKISHPVKLALIERALALAPEDELLDRALVEEQAARGNPRPALRMALRRLNLGHGDERTASLIRIITAVANKGQLGDQMLGQLMTLATQSKLKEPVLEAICELLTQIELFNSQTLIIFEKLYKQNPDNPRHRRWYAVCLSEIGEDEKASEHFEELIEDAGQDDELVLASARTNARMGRHLPELLPLAEKAVDLDSDDSELLYHLAAIELAAGKIDQAAGHFQEILNTYPEMHARLLTYLEHARDYSSNEGRFLLLLTRLFTLSGRLEKALATLARLQPSYQQYLGEMIACYELILEKDEDNVRARIERGILYRLGGHLDEAENDFAEAYRLAPGNLDILAEYVDILEYRAMSCADPDPDLFARIGEFYLTLENIGSAAEMAERALEVDGRHDQALHLMVRLQLNDYALDDCRKTIVKLAPSESKVGLLQELARAYEERGEHGKAAEVLSDAIELSPEQRDVLERLRTLNEQHESYHREEMERTRVHQTLSPKAQNRYDLREEIGRGSMGVVFKAYDRELDEIVVLKILPERIASNPEALARFRNEAKAARKLSHPNIVRIHDIGEEAGRKHISMEYVSGGTLKDYLQKLTELLTPQDAIDFIRQVGRALVHAHDEGVLHRDIKTGNLLMAKNGRLKLSDFGIAALAEVANRELQIGQGTGTVFGTPLYMSPEQFTGSRLSPASDLYSVGILFYELLTGAPPFTKGSLSYHHQFTPPPKIESIPEPIWSLVERLLAKDPAARYQDAKELLGDLDNWQGRVRSRPEDQHGSSTELKVTTPAIPGLASPNDLDATQVLPSSEMDQRPMPNHGKRKE